MVRFDIFSNGDRVFERIDVEYSGRSLPALHIYLGKLYIYDCVYPSGVSIRNRDPAFYFSTGSWFSSGTGWRRKGGFRGR